MSLTQRVQAEPANARRARQNHPKGFEPGVKFSIDSGLPESAVICSTVELDAEDHRAKIEEQTNLKIPASLDVRLERLTLQNGADGTAERWWYKYVFVTRLADVLNEDTISNHVASLKGFRKNRKAIKPAHTGESTFVISWNDWQAGKAEGGGTAALLERYEAQIAAVKARAVELRKIGRDLGRLVIIGGGDMVEGCTIFPHQMMHIDADRRGQINTVTDMILFGLDELAPLFADVTVLAVGGNHGEHRIDGNRTNRTDNDDCLVFETAARVAGRDDRLAHVNFVIAQGEPAKTIDINGWVYATTHGQAFGRGAGRPEQKAHNWYKGQAGGRFPAGDADVLVSHHYHHKAERDWGACLWIQTPANDGGSMQHTDLTGEHAESGMLTWVVTPERRYQDAQVI
jgi:hypothetical protein